MAFSAIEINKTTWTKIGDNVTSVTFKNLSSQVMYVAYTVTDSAPVETVGMPYPYMTGETKATISDLSHTVGAMYVWAKLASGNTGNVVVEAG